MYAKQVYEARFTVDQSEESLPNCLSIPYAKKITGTNSEPQPVNNNFHHLASRAPHAPTVTDCGWFLNSV